jgi:ATP-binding cassette, subfamily B, bacterial
LKTLSIDQFQAVGASFINELKNILITIIAAKLVMDGEITLGMMLSVSYILGQLNSPLHQMIEFFSLGQKAKISLERLLEIQNRPDEYSNSISNEKEFEVNADIALSNVSFYYTKAHKVLSNIDLLIPGNKVTAIVGPSGSGKTTLLKLLLKIHDPVEGEIKIGKSNLKNVELQRWRNECGVVMQEGFIFNDTVANNITIGQGTIDSKRLKQALKIANIDAFIETLPLGINTMLGSEGLDLSVGQKQRILIARAVYKNPQILLFDEATSSLDANNEKIIMSNLKEFFENRTVIIIAHRLSTVMNADQIVVLDGGEIREVGNHESLLRSRGQYYGLIKNQLQLERIGTYEDLNVK